MTSVGNQTGHYPLLDRSLYSFLAVALMFISVIPGEKLSVSIHIHLNDSWLAEAELRNMQSEICQF